jgi:hypothetical protein
MELQKIIEMMQGASIYNNCQYSLQVYTHNWLNERELIASINEIVADQTIRKLYIVNGVNESMLNEFFGSCNVQQSKLARTIAARDKLNAEIAAMGGETIICNEVK